MASSFYGSNSSCASPTFSEVLARLQRLESNIDGFNELRNNELTLGEILTKLNNLCLTQNQQTVILSDLQSRVNALETGGSPLIESVSAGTIVATPITIVRSFCTGTALINVFSDGSSAVAEDPSNNCTNPADPVPCALTLCINIQAGRIYFFRNTGGVTLDGLMAPGSATYIQFSNSGTGTKLNSYIGDPRSPSGSDSRVVYYPEIGDLLLLLPEQWQTTGGTVDVGSNAINEWFTLEATASGTLCLPAAGIDYYGSSETHSPDPNNPLTYESIPWNVNATEVPAEATCS